MTTIRNLSAAIVAVSIALSGTAQAQSAPAASMPMGGAMMSHDCARPMAKSGPCAAGAAATAPEGAASTAQTKKLPKHNHRAEKNN